MKQSEARKKQNHEIVKKRRRDKICSRLEKLSAMAHSRLRDEKLAKTRHYSEWFRFLAGYGIGSVQHFANRRWAEPFYIAAEMNVIKGTNVIRHAQRHTIEKCLAVNPMQKKRESVRQTFMHLKWLSPTTNIKNNAMKIFQRFVNEEFAIHLLFVF